jgi:hypothetical protein
VTRDGLPVVSGSIVEFRVERPGVTSHLATPGFISLIII